MAPLTYTPYPVKMFEYITADVKTALGLSVLHYEHGHPAEIVNTLRQMTQDPTQSISKFPLIALFQDFDEKRGEKVGRYDVSFHLIIATLTDRTYLASQRMTVNFIPVLYPIYDELMASIARSRYFSQYPPEKIVHTKTDRLFWGKTGLYGNEASVFDDCIDAIEIQNLQLTIIQKCSTDVSNIE